MNLKGTPFGFGLFWAILSNFEQIENLKNKIIISVFTSLQGSSPWCESRGLALPPPVCLYTTTNYCRASTEDLRTL